MPIREFSKSREVVVTTALAQPSLFEDPKKQRVIRESALSAYAEVLDRTALAQDDIPDKVNLARQSLSTPSALFEFTKRFYPAVRMLREIGHKRDFRPSLRVPEHMPSEDFEQLDVDTLVKITR